MDLSLLDYRRRTADCYHRVRAADDPVAAWRDWARTRDDLFATHPQSPLDDPADFAGIPLFDHDPTWRLEGTFEPVDGDPLEVAHSADGATPFVALGRVDVVRDEIDHHLDLLWLAGYGDGVFLPFRDATNGDETYGGGRYLLDTVKGPDLGHDGDRMVLDFNFSYHPSCVHDDRWSCPLSPPGNTLDTAVRAGERLA